MYLHKYAADAYAKLCYHLIYNIPIVNAHMPLHVV